MNEQAAQAMSYQKSAQIQAQSQDQRIKELTAELQQVRSSASQLNQNFQQASLDLQAANAQMGSYVQQIDALNVRLPTFRNARTFNAKTLNKRLRNFVENKLILCGR